MFKKAITLFKNQWQAHRDAKMNRKMVGKDRLGNIYYQQYDDFGSETKREVQYLNHLNIVEADLDPVWDDWLHRRRQQPFTPEEQLLLYKEYDRRKEIYKLHSQYDRENVFKKDKNWKQ